MIIRMMIFEDNHLVSIEEHAADNADNDHGIDDDQRRLSGLVIRIMVMMMICMTMMMMIMLMRIITWSA